MPLQPKPQSEVFEWVEILRNVALFSELSKNDAALGQLASLMQQEYHKANHPLIKEGELGDRFYILLKGEVSIFNATPEGETYKVIILKSEMHPSLGEGGIVEAEPRSATAICDTDCEFLVLSRESFQKFTEQAPQWAIPIMHSLFKALMGRIRKLNNDMIMLHTALTEEIRGL